MNGNEHLSAMVAPLLDWYKKNARDLPWRQNVTPYRVWISEIMLQQTRVEAVRAYFIRFMQALPEIRDLAQVPEQQLLKLWEGLGYYSRARNLQKAALQIMEKHGGELPGEYPLLLKLPGIGPYTAGAIASIAFNLPQPAVDGNVLRVYSRYQASSADIMDARVKKQVEADLRAIMPKKAGMFNQSLMELGATICAPNGAPACLICPLASLCEGKRRGIAANLPYKTAKKPRRIEKRMVLLLLRDNLIALRRRPARGLLAGLWELPSLDGEKSSAALTEAVRGYGLEPLRIEPMGDTKHIFTHVEWHMTGYKITVEQNLDAAPLVWINPKQLTEEYPLPSAFRFFLQEYREKFT